MKVDLKNNQVLLILVLLLITILAYWKIQENQFVILDDFAYLSENPHVSNGFSIENIKWAVSSFYACNWHPLTWLSHMLDTELYGNDPRGHHLNNLYFHLINILLLFFLLHRMTKAFWQSLFVAALFALHPLNVESVAWAAERKNVLSTFFWMLSFYAYIHYTEKRTLGRYLLIVFLFGLGLMSKPMLVTLPFTLILLDIWPLDRLKNDRLVNFNKKYFKILIIATRNKFKGLHLVAEKIPLLFLSAGSSFLTLMAQKKWHALKSFEYIPLDTRIANAIISYKNYIVKMVWPDNLAFLYPYPRNSISFSETLCSLSILIFITLIVIRFSFRFKYLLVGWFWYLGTLIPVIGLIQVGSQQMADRYTYIPLIGLFIILAWGIPAIIPSLHHRGKYFGIFASIILIFLAISTYIQTGYWRDSKVLFMRTQNVTSDNYLAHYNLGIISSGQADLEGAISQFKAALSIEPDFADAHYNLANALMKKGGVKEAIFHYSEAIRINPRDEMAHNNLGIAFVFDHNIDQALTHFSRALSINPNYEEARTNLSLTLQINMETETY